MQTTTVIVGAGHAAGQAIASLKQKKYAGHIVLIGDEAFLPYQRPPLSKKFLAGEMPAERLYVKPHSFYDDPKIHLHLGTRADAISPDRRVVYAADQSYAYDDLIIATGSQVRRVSCPGSDLEGIFYLRTIDDVTRIRNAMADKSRIVIVGAGYIGLEVAAVCRSMGCNVTVLEMADRVMSRVVSPEISAFYQDEHTAKGVHLKLSTGLAEFAGQQSVEAVVTTDGQSVAADAVIVGIGIEPNTQLADAAGIDVDNGIVVDTRCKTSASRIYAIGDCTSHPSRVYDRMLRLESVQNALEQAKTAVGNICGGDVQYDQVPWFWSDQYDLKLQIAGLSQGYDEVVIRGSMQDRCFSCLYLSDGRLIAVDAVNSPREFLQSKILIANHALMDGSRLSDSDLPLNELTR